ncbi:WD domain, G-beta repeat protein, partial [Rhizoctonia solani AG-3 Rhs1AP]
MRVWSVLTGKLVCQLVTAHKSPIRCLGFSLDGAQLCSGSDDATVAVWDIGSGVMVASSSVDRTIRIWDMSTGALTYKLDGHKSSVSSVSFSPDGILIVSGSADGVIIQWDAKAGTLIDTILPRYPYTYLHFCPESKGILLIHYVCFSPDGTRIISGFKSSLRLVDAPTMNLISKIELPTGECVCWVGYSPDGMDIISVSTSKGVGTSKTSKDSTQQSAQSPNIIRAWRANVRPDQMSSSSSPRDWSYEKDGRIMSPEGFVMWIPPNLRWQMKVHMELGSESHYSPLVMSSNEFINIGYRDLCIGNRWAECYVLES